jgi:hypothetical protein
VVAVSLDCLNHFHELVMLLEAIRSDPSGFSDDLLSWRPLTYEEHFAESGFRDKNLAIAAYRREPPKIRARFDEAVAGLHGDEVAAELKSRSKTLNRTCQKPAQRLRMLIDEANAIANGECCPTVPMRKLRAMSAAKPRSTLCSAAVD